MGRAIGRRRMHIPLHSLSRSGSSQELMFSTQNTKQERIRTAILPAATKISYEKPFRSTTYDSSSISTAQAASQPFKIDVGTITDFPEECSCPTFRPIIEKALQGFEEHAFNKHFAAGGCGTITSFARNDLGIEAAQFEINARYRIVQSRSNPAIRAREQDVLDMIARLQRMILDINECNKEDRQSDMKRLGNRSSMTQSFLLFDFSAWCLTLNSRC